MKRLAALLMALAIVLGLTACTSGNTDESTGATEPSTDPTETLNVYEPPAGTQIRNILMIGNSNCSYFNDELYAIAKADGIELVVANLYISGCSVEKHVEQMEYGLPYTKYTIHDAAGKSERVDEVSLQDALAERDWDAITLQQHYDPLLCTNIAVATASTNRYAKKIYDYLKTAEPNALLFWHQNWAFQLGYPGDPNAHEDKKIETEEKQTANHLIMQESSKLVCHENQTYRIPTGDAWQLARADARIGHVLSNKDTAGTTDYIHDGEAGGGQYLNACVWYEVLMQKSCIGNTFRPDYALSEEKILVLQQIAHDAVAAVYGDDYAK